MIDLKSFEPSIAEEKLWGIAEHGTIGDLLCSKISIKIGGFSSIHYHEKMENTFIILEGRLRIFTYNREEMEKGLPKKEGFRDLVPFDIISIEKEIAHRFFALTKCRAVEIYHGDFVSREDIYRYDKGGIDRVHDCRCG